MSKAKKLNFNKVVTSESFKSIISAIVCALIGILVGFIILLMINAENAPPDIIRKGKSLLSL